MSREEPIRPPLRLIQGGLHRQVTVEGVRVVAAPKHRSPFPVDAVVAEEDTYLVLSADSAVLGPSEHPIRLMTAVWEASPQPLGSVLVKRGTPLRLLAVIHDLNEDPTWREEWISKALETVFSEAGSLGLRSLALPFIGTVHGRLTRERFLDLLRRALCARSLDSGLERVWLVLPDDVDSEIVDRLVSAR